MEYKKISEITTKGDSLTKIHSIYHGKQTGKYRFYNSTNDNVEYSDDYDIKDECIIIREYGNPMVYIDSCFSYSNDFIILKITDKSFLSKYVYYYLKYSGRLEKKICIKKQFKYISSDSLGKILIPSIPIEKQQQIVDELDKYEITPNTITQTILTYEDSKKSIFDNMFDECKSSKKAKLGDLIEVDEGTSINNDDITTGDYQIYGVHDNIHHLINKSNCESDYFICYKGIYKPCVRFVNGKFFLNENAWKIKLISKDVDYHFIGNYLIHIESQLASMAQNDFDGISKKEFYDIELLLPSLDEQRKISKRLFEIEKSIQTYKSYVTYNNDFVKHMFNNEIDVCLVMK